MGKVSAVRGWGRWRATDETGWAHSNIPFLESDAWSDDEDFNVACTPPCSTVSRSIRPRACRSRTLGCGCGGTCCSTPGPRLSTAAPAWARTAQRPGSARTSTRTTSTASRRTCGSGRTAARPRASPGPAVASPAATWTRSTTTAHSSCRAVQGLRPRAVPLGRRRAGQKPAHTRQARVRPRAGGGESRATVTTGRRCSIIGSP